MINFKEGGWEVIIHQDGDIRVKLLRINKDECTSLQYHNHKAEFMVCVGGEGQIRIGVEHHRIFKRGDYIYIPPRCEHRIIGTRGITVLELSVGEEGDIVRLDDKYGRVKNGKNV